METISHRLQSKKGGDAGHGPTAAAASSAVHTEKHHSSDSSSGPDHHPAAHGLHHPQAHDVGGSSASLAKSTSSTVRARKHAAGSKEKAGAEKTFNFQWDEGESCCTNPTSFALGFFIVMKGRNTTSRLRGGGRAGTTRYHVRCVGAPALRLNRDTMPNRRVENLHE